MKLGHLIFNVVGISIALFLALAEVFNLDAEVTHARFFHHWPGLWSFCVLYNIFLVLLIGGGSLANLINRRLKPGPTIGIVVGYALSIVFIPLAVWGIYYARERIKRHAKAHAFNSRMAVPRPDAHTPAQSRLLLIRELQHFWERWF